MRTNPHTLTNNQAQTHTNPYMHVAEKWNRLKTTYLYPVYFKWFYSFGDLLWKYLFTCNSLSLEGPPGGDKILKIWWKIGFTSCMGLTYNSEIFCNCASLSHTHTHTHTHTMIMCVSRTENMAGRFWESSQANNRSHGTALAFVVHQGACVK